MKPRTRSIAVTALLVAAAGLSVASPKKQKARIPKIRCDAPPGVYAATPYGKWIALVKSNKGRVTSYGAVVIYRKGNKVGLVGKNYNRDGKLRYTWRGLGTYVGSKKKLLYLWKISGRSHGINKMFLTNGNAKLTGYWFRKGAKGRESFCRAVK